MKKTIYSTKLFANRERGLAHGVVTGLASLLTLASPPQTSYRGKPVSAEKALRGDFIRIGMDMRKAAAEEIAHEKASR